MHSRSFIAHAYSMRWLASAIGLAWVITLATVAVAEDTVAEDAESAVIQAKALSRAFRRAAHTAMPSVVTVLVRESPDRLANNPLSGTPWEEPHRGYQNRRLAQRTVGSGVIVAKSGIIVTNYHVVSEAETVTIRLSDGREFPAAEIKTDRRSDLAVIRIRNASDLTRAPLGNSDHLEIGDWVIAIGSPFELEQTVSAGIISGKGRQLDRKQRARYLQTDAAINPGSSGGPLVNLDGEVVGINSAIATQNGGNQGIGFAIPSNLARWVVTQLVKTGRVERAYLGVGLENVSRATARELNLQPTRGVRVSRVYRNAPAEEAGLRQGDIIARFGNVVVTSPYHLQRVVERSPLGSRQPLTVFRDGKQHIVKVRLRKLPDVTTRTASARTR